MLFPKEKMSHTSIYQGNKSEEGWLVLSIGNMELEGVNKVYIDLRDIEWVKERSSRESEVLGKTKRLLGGI